MATKIWTGNAPIVQQITKIQASGFQRGDSAVITRNQKSLTVTATKDPVAYTESGFVSCDQEILNGIAAAIGAYDNSIPEFRELAASAIADENGDVTHVLVYGPTDGTPFTITSSETQGEVSVVTETVQPYVEASTKKIRFQRGGTPTSGRYKIRITYDDADSSHQAEATCAYNASAATIKSAIDTAIAGLSGTPIPAITDVTGSASDFTIEFPNNSGRYSASINHGYEGYGGLYNLNGNAAITVKKIQPQGFKSCRYVLDVGELIASSSYSLTDVVTLTVTKDNDGDGEIETNETNSTTVYLPLGDATEILAQLESIASVIELVAGKEYQLEFSTGIFMASEVSVSLTDKFGANLETYITRTQEADGVQGSIHRISITGNPYYAGFTLDGLPVGSSVATSTLSTNSTAAQIKTALDTAFSGSGLTPVFVVTKHNDYEFDIETTTYNTTQIDWPVDWNAKLSTSKTGCRYSVTTVSESVVAKNMKQVVSFSSPELTSGTFTLSILKSDGTTETTGDIAYNASAGDVETELEGLASIGSGNVTVTLQNGQYTVEWTNGDAYYLTGDGSDLVTDTAEAITISTHQSPSGPNWFSAAKNWSTGTAPTATDVLIFENSDVSCLYGLGNISSSTFAAVHVKRSYVGRIGLPDWNENGYPEDRTKSLTIQASKLIVGQGEGSGSNFLRFNTQTVTCAVTVYYTGQAEGTLPAMLLDANASGTTVSVIQGSIGICSASESTTGQIGTLKMSYRDSIESDAYVSLGSGLTIATIEKNGGTLYCACDVGTRVTNEAGTVIFEGDDIDLNKLLITGGEARYMSNGTITYLFVGSGAVFDRSGGMADITVDEMTVEAGATVNDPYDTVTWTWIGLLNCNISEATLNIGSVLTIVRNSSGDAYR